MAATAVPTAVSSADLGPWPAETHRRERPQAVPAGTPLPTPAETQQPQPKPVESKPAEMALGKPPEAPEPVKLNSFGRAINMSVPLKDGLRVVGDVMIRISADSSVAIRRADLSERLGPLLSEQARTGLAGVKEAEGMVALGDVQAAGLGLTFDSGMMELVFEPTADQRPVGALSMLAGTFKAPGPEAATVQPAAVSGFVNILAGADHRWADGRGTAQTSANLDVEAVVRVWDVVLEGLFSYDGAVDTFQCPAEAQCDVTHRSGVKRQYSRAVYDLPSQRLRFHLGDAAIASSGLQANGDFLGLRIDHSPQAFAPGENARPTGNSTLRIERTSDVEVRVNGFTAHQVKLRPGVYSLSDLPLQAGANHFDLVITDDTGAQRTVSFTRFSSDSLLAPGRLEWSGGVGVPSYLRDNDRKYQMGDWIGSMFARYGITEGLTGEINFQADPDVRHAGLSLYAALPLGFVTLQGALTHSDLGLGYAGIAAYDLTNFPAIAHHLWGGGGDSLRLSAEYRSDDYRTVGALQTTATGILVPQYNYSWRFDASYSLPITDRITATLSGRYQIGNEDAFKISPLTVARDRYGADLTLSAPLTDWMSGSISAGWGNDSLLRDLTRADRDDPEFRVGVRLTIRPDDKVQLASQYNSRNREAGTSGQWQNQYGTDRWDASANVHRYDLSDTVQSHASVGYGGNRFEARVSHATGVRASNSTLLPADNRTSVRAGTAIAFAGSKVAVGAPVRGNAFAIVNGHESIADKAITVGSMEAPKAKTDWLGPALVSNLPAYAAANLPVDVDDLPTGYSLGAGGFTTFAPYRAGYGVEIGSAYSISAYGTLETAPGEPVALLSGVAKSAEHPGKEIAIFTNSAGKFGAEGLAPGRWAIEIAAPDLPIRYEIDVPKSADGLFRAGTLRPADSGKEARS
jgi:outer membrane usher protein